jgi:hypothetical protein
MIAAAIVSATVVPAIIAIGSRCRRADRRRTIGSAAPSAAIGRIAHRCTRYRTTGYGTVSIAATRNADTTGMNGSAPELGGADTAAVEPTGAHTAPVKTSTSPKAAPTTRNCIIGNEADGEEN